MVSPKRVFARQLRKNTTETEKTLWKILRKKQIHNYKFRRQHPIGKYIVDFYCPDKKLIIELDGGQHAANSSYDKKRDEDLKSAGYRVIRFWDNEVLTNMEGTVSVIEEALKL